MNKLYNFFTTLLIIISLTIIINSIFVTNGQIKTTVNFIMLILVIIMAIVALLFRFINDKKENNK
ncbi:hypothetical protein NQ035_13590 [Staphylococcus gallinarum]|uniref:hypothetical protein n=1 Tax=Staphylococcus gallinarum TaxID=1293 RepID=UPI00211C3724|nr:hypothetical protein [Staphylococcus gallinarum]MCQ9289891.1 hypothetical protein [Staphylococcus gallinarum]